MRTDWGNNVKYIDKAGLKTVCWPVLKALVDSGRAYHERSSPTKCYRTSGREASKHEHFSPVAKDRKPAKYCFSCSTSRRADT